MEFVSLVVIIALIQNIYFALLAGKARSTYEVKAPAMTGHEMFERANRVHQNTIEQLIVFIPSIYMCGYFLHDLAAAIVGLFFIIGRAMYCKAYMADPATRAKGMITGFIAINLLILGTLVGIILNLIA